MRRFRLANPLKSMKIYVEEVSLLLHTTVTKSMVYNYPILFAIATLYIHHFYILYVFYILKW